MTVEKDIDPAVQRAAERLRAAYQSAQEAQDPLVKGSERANILKALEEATAITQASELRTSTHTKSKSGNN